MLCRLIKDEGPVAHAVVVVTSLEVLTDIFVCDLQLKEPLAIGVASRTFLVSCRSFICLFLIVVN